MNNSWLTKMTTWTHSEGEAQEFENIEQRQSQKVLTVFMEFAPGLSLTLETAHLQKKGIPQQVKTREMKIGETHKKQDAW